MENEYKTHSLFELCAIFDNEFNRETMIDDMLVVSNHFHIFIFQHWESLRESEKLKFIDWNNEVNSELSIDEVQKLRNDFDYRWDFEIMIEKKFESYIDNFIKQTHHLDFLFFKDLERNIHKFKIILTRLNPIHWQLNFMHLNGYETRFKEIDDFFWIFKQYLPGYQIPAFTDTEIQKLNKRVSQKQPSNKQRLKALSEFCPDFIIKLHKLSNDEKKDIIHLITGVNRDDCYKFIFTADQRILNETQMDFDQIDFEDLKTKLKNTETNK